MEGAGAIKWCGMIQACNFAVKPLSLLEKKGSIVYSDALDLPT